jgi:hypothetical protein
LAWALGKRPETTSRNSVEPVVYHVNRLGSDGASDSLFAALTKIQAKGGHAPARIVVHDDLAESEVPVNLPNVTIEADAGKTIHWKPGTKRKTPGYLLYVNKAEGFHLKGFTLDGENRLDYLVNVYHHCPGLVFEDLTLRGFNRYGIWVTNCEGGPSPDKHLLFTRLVFDVPRADQTALFFSIRKEIQAIPKNKYFIVRDCTFNGPGAKVKTPDLATLEQAEFPAGVQPVAGQ